MNGQRIRNTRAERLADAEKPQAPIREERVPKKILIPFSLYTQHADADGTIFRHMAPTTYYCRTLQIFLDSPSLPKVRIQLGVDNTEFIERDLESGQNIFQVERIIPAGTRVRMKVLEGEKVVGAWAAWVGEVDA